MSEARYDKLTKRTLIEKLLEAERQLRALRAKTKPDRALSERRHAGKKEESKDSTVSPASREAKNDTALSQHRKVDSSAATERNFTAVGKDGSIRRLYEVVKDIRDDAGDPVFSEGALYEISAKTSAPGVTPGDDHPPVPDGSDQTELICRFRPNGTLTYVNEAYCRYFGCDRDDLHSRNILLSVSEPDRENVFSRLKDLRPEHPVDTLEYRVLTVFGDVLWNQWTYRALFDDSGNILEYQSVGRDITFRKYTQDVLEKRAAILEAVTFAAEGFLKSTSWRDRIERVLERFGAAMNASHVFLCENHIGQEGDITVPHSYEWHSPQIKDAGNRKKILRNSELAVRFSRWVYEKCEGRPIYGTIGQFPDKEVGDLALDKMVSIAVVPVLMGDRWWGFVGFADYSGDIQWTEDEIAPLGAASEILGSAIEREEKERALEQNHTTILEQERFLAGIFDAIQDGIMVVAPDMTILRVNKTIEKRFPHTPTLPGRKCYEAYYGLKSPCSDCASQKTLNTGMSASMTRSIVGPDGDIKGWVDVFSYPWIDHSTGKLKGVIEYSRDISERKRAEEARQQSDERLQTFLNSYRDPVFLKDNDRRYLFVNEAGLSLLERTREEIIGKTDSEMFDLADAAEMEKEKADLRLLKQDGGPLLYEQLIKGRILESAKFRVNLENGRVGIGGILRDVTEQKKAQEALRQNEAMLQSILQAAPIGIAFGEGRVLKWTNEFFDRMSGYSREELAGSSSRILYPDNEEEFLRVGEAFYTGIERDGIGITEAQWTRKNGARINVMLSMSPLFPEDAKAGVVVTAIDVTEKKMADEALRASEARYRELADNMPAGIYEATLDGKVIYANRTALDMFGFSADEIEKGVKFSEFVAPEEREVLARNVQRIREGAAFDYEYAMLRRGGSRFFGLNVARPQIRDGRVVGSTGVITDVSDLRKAQEALRNNEALLGSILRVAPIGVGMVHNRILGWVNEGMTEMTGYSAEEITGKSARAVYPDEEEFERAGREKYAQIAARGKGAVETRWKRKDGTVIDVHLNSAPIDPADLAAGVVFTAMDITAQKKAARILLFAKEDLEKQVADQTRELDISNMLLKIELEEHRKTEEALTQSEHLYRAIVEDQTDLICRFLPDGTLSFVNGAFCRYFEKSRDEVLGSRYFPSIPREDRRKIWTAYGSLTPKRPVYHLEFRIEMPDGSVRWVNWTNRAVYDESGTLIEHQGVARDITERKQSEQQLRQSRNMLRSVFDGISDPLIMVREDMTVVMLNRTALRYFGALLYRDMIGACCLESFQGRYGQEATSFVQAVIAEQEPARYELTTKGDSARYEEVFVYPVLAGGGDGSMAIIRITDRTKQRLMERELIQSEKLASLGLLISGIVHEINNPNNFISFNIPILRDYLHDILPVLDEHSARTTNFEVQGMPYTEFRIDVMKLLENVEHGSTRINTTVAKLKEFSRKKDEKGARPILPTSVVERAVAICHTQIRKTVKTFEVQVMQDMSEMVSDPDAIEQTLINLLINAAQAADKPDSYIRLKVWQDASGKEGLVMEVDDNGCGMDGKTVSRIFDPFFTTKEEGLGTGLGLYISRNLLESVGGSISVESEIGRGATFRVVIPALGDPGTSEKPSEQKGVDA
jgi:PAS domain S-box-containing protein